MNVKSRQPGGFDPEAVPELPDNIGTRRVKNLDGAVRTLDEIIAAIEAHTLNYHVEKKDAEASTTEVAIHEVVFGMALTPDDGEVIKENLVLDVATFLPEGWEGEPKNQYEPSLRPGESIPNEEFVVGKEPGDLNPEEHTLTDYFQVAMLWIREWVEDKYNVQVAADDVATTGYGANVEVGKNNGNGPVNTYAVRMNYDGR